MQHAPLRARNVASWICRSSISNSSAIHSKHSIKVDLFQVRLSPKRVEVKKKVQLSPNEYIREKSRRVHWSTTGLQNISLTKLHLSICILCSWAELHENHLSPIVGRGPQSNEPTTNWKIGI